ncbi:MAG: hypothetical protein GY699_07755 [Desulfobacteraceae bacterium]|nr:hypothetical protein [Desulfobacteraceae bacterium]
MDGKKKLGLNEHILQIGININRAVMWVIAAAGPSLTQNAAPLFKPFFDKKTLIDLSFVYP